VDAGYLQTIKADSIGFSRRIGTADYTEMVYYQQDFGGPHVPVVWYQGINDRFEGKVSDIMLCVDGKWVELQGMD
jgi:hypothetical protein